VSLAPCRRTIAKFRLYALDVGYRRCTNSTNSVSEMTYRELKRKWSKPVRPISPDGLAEYQ
jgi:hypothetical protein